MLHIVKISPCKSLHKWIESGFPTSMSLSVLSWCQKIILLLNWPNQWVTLCNTLKNYHILFLYLHHEVPSLKKQLSLISIFRNINIKPFIKNRRRCITALWFFSPSSHCITGIKNMSLWLLCGGLSDIIAPELWQRIFWEFSGRLNTRTDC